MSKSRFAPVVLLPIFSVAAIAGSTLLFAKYAAANDEAIPQKTSEQAEEDSDLVQDRKLIQGTWELQHNGGKTRSVKTIKGNTETLRRFNKATGPKTSEHSVQLKLSKTGDVRVCTFYGIGRTAESGLSFVYKVDKENFYDIPGLLNGEQFRNYQSTPKVWHWKRIQPPEANLEEQSN